MALQKQSVPINFTKGIETKSDPYQLPLDNFSALNNTVFGTTGRLTKRNGFDNISTLPNTDQTVLTTYNNNLVATGSNLYTFNQDTDIWTDQGKIQPVQVNTMSLVRNSSSQSSPDFTLADNGLACFVYMDSSLGYYHVIDSITGQQIIGRTALPATSTNPKVYVFGSYFIITFMMTVTGTPTLRYLAINTAIPEVSTEYKTISSDVDSITAGYDAISTTSRFFIAWGASSNTVKIAYITRSLTVSTASSISGITADIMSMAINTTTSRLFITYWESGSTDGYSASYDFNLNKVMTETQVINGIEVREITSIIQDSILNVFYETVDTYSYSDVSSDYISTLTVTPPATVTTGTVSAPSVVLRSVGLVSQAFLGDDNVIYMMVAYGDMNQSPSTNNSNQPTYFLIDSTGAVYMKLAYSNGGGYASTNVLAKITRVNDTYYFPYQLTDFLASVNKTTNLDDGVPVNAIYTQTGISLATFMLNDGKQYSSEIASALHLTGGQFWEFDGVKPVEHGFHLWPEDILISGSNTVSSMTPQNYFYTFTYEWTDNQGMLHRSAPSIPYRYEIVTPPANFTADTTDMDATLTNVSDFTDLQIGQVLSGTGIAAGAYITAIDEGTNTIEMSAAATVTDTTVTITPTIVTRVNINVPTLRVTLKDETNPVRIVGYRWSEAQQVYYQFTSLTSPNLNDTSVDSITIVDGNSDAQIIGNTLLYTTGGVLENIGAPASVDSTLFDNRAWLIDAEDQNLLWYSKAVIQAVPVEFSDALTLYVAPTIGSQSSTGPMRCIVPMDDKLIIFKSNAIYYINGSGPDNTGSNSAYSQPTYITAAVGSDNPNSIVIIPQGLMFKSNKGIWLLRRDLGTTYIGAAVEAYNSAEVLSAEVIPNTTQVRFILDNNKTLMYDYFYDQWGVHTNVRAISGTIYQDAHTYLNSSGIVFQETPGRYKDGSSPVLISLTTAWINIAGVQGFERFYFANLLGTYYTPFKLQVQIAFDYNPSPIQSTIVLPVANVAPDYGDEAVWGSGGPWGGSEGNVFSARVFPIQQKCQSFQVTLTEIYDPSYDIEAGQGLSLSGLNLIIGVKRGFRTQRAAKSFG